MPTFAEMDVASIVSLFARARELAVGRWRQLAAAIGLTATLGAVLFFVLLKVASGGSDGGGDSGMPSMAGLYLSLTIAWAILVTTFVIPMAASTAAIADEFDDSTLGWIGPALRSLPWMWLRLAIPTLPFLLLGMWAITDLISAFSAMSEALTAPATGTAPADPGEPFSFQVLELLFGSAPMRWAVFSTILGLWFMWSATRVTGLDEGRLPHAPWRLFGRSPIVIGILAGVTAVILGPLLSKSLGSLGQGLGLAEGAVETAGAEGAGTMVALLVGMVISAFISVAVIPWIALFGDADGEVIHYDDEGTTSPEAIVEPAMEAAPPTAPVAQPAHQVVDQTHLTPAGASAGAWWYLQPGAQVLVQVAAAPGITVTSVAADAAGTWITPQASGQPDAASFIVPAAGWFLLGAWNSGEQPANVAMRFTLPADAQPAPAQQAAG